MNTNTFRIIFSIFLIAHGLMTVSLSTVPAPVPGALHTPFFPGWWRTDIDSTWPAFRLGLPDGFVRTIGWVLWMAAFVLFTAAGAGLLGFPGLDMIWHILAAVAAGVSLVLLSLYWHPWLVIGILLNVTILLGVVSGWFVRQFTAS